VQISKASLLVGGYLRATLIGWDEAAYAVLSQAATIAQQAIESRGLRTR
jgi:hypothetical protein